MSTNHPLSNEPPMTGSVTGCSTDQPSAPDAESSGPVKGHVGPSTNGCRYNWVGDRMRESLDAMEKERRPNCPQLNILDPTPIPVSQRACQHCGHTLGKCHCFDDTGVF